jgi:hypothetical protein
VGGIRPEFSALFGSNKSIRAGENLFAWDSAPLTCHSILTVTVRSLRPRNKLKKQSTAISTVAGVRLFTAKQRLPSEHLECVVLPAHDGRKGDAESLISIGRVDGLGG